MLYSIVAFGFSNLPDYAVFSSSVKTSTGKWSRMQRRINKQTNGKSSRHGKGRAETSTIN
jgi:hypothetical protein